MSKENEITITTYKTGQIYFVEGWYSVEDLRKMVEVSDKRNEIIVKGLLNETT